jgi:hypothetical protein
MSVEVTIRYATTVDSLADGERGDRLVSALWEMGLLP